MAKEKITVYLTEQLLKELKHHIIESGEIQSEAITGFIKDGLSKGKDKDYLNCEDVADLLGFQYTQITRMAKKREIPAFKESGQWRFPKDRLYKYLDDISMDNVDKS